MRMSQICDREAIGGSPRSVFTPRLGMLSGQFQGFLRIDGDALISITEASRL